MRYLGIDYGSRKCGLALSDESGAMGFPHAVVQTAGLELVLRNLITKEGVEAVVIGESRDFAGNENPVMEGARNLGAWVRDTLGLPVYWEPEMFTTAEARRARDESTTGRSPKNTEDVDASAAALILTSYLNKPHG